MYFANWEIINYTINYDLQGGTVDPANPETYNINSNTITLNNPQKTGFIFVGWNGSNGRTPQIKVIIPKGSVNDRNYVANWDTVKFDIIYELQGGIVEPPNPIVYDEETDNITLNNPNKTGYIFKGWTGSNGQIPI